MAWMPFSFFLLRCDDGCTWASYKMDLKLKKVMPLIKQIEPTNATGRLSRFYKAALDRGGYIAGIIKLMSQDPLSCEASVNLHDSLMNADNGLSRSQREMLATVVSNVNHCFYLTLSHSRNFAQESGKAEVARKLIWNYQDCSEEELGGIDRALCDYAVKLTLVPGCMDPEDIEKLKSLGLGDQQITVAVQLIGYFNYANRVADGLTIELEDWMDEYSRDDWLANKTTYLA